MVEVEGLLLLEHVQARAPQLILAKRLGQCHGIHHGAASGVHQHGIRLHEGQTFGVDQMMRLGSKRGMQAHHVRRLQQLFQAQHGVTFGSTPPGFQATRPAHHLKAHTSSFLGRRSADFTHADDAEHATAALPERARACIIPHAAAHIGIKLVDPAQNRKRQRNGVIRHHFRTVTGHVAHGNAILGCGLHIDLVVPDARTADRLQVRAGLEHLAREHRIRRHCRIGAGLQQSIDNRLSGAAACDLELDARIPGHSFFQVVILEIGIDRYDLRHIHSPRCPC